MVKAVQATIGELGGRRGRKKAHQGLGLGPAGHLRLWTEVSSRANSLRATEKGPVEALKVRGHLANAMVCLGQHVPAKCSATICNSPLLLRS